MNPSRLHHEESGFSLIELLIVVLVLGILAAVVIPRFFAQRDSAKNGVAITSIRNAEVALNTYFMQNAESFAAEGDYDLEENLAIAMGSDNAPGREKGLVWTGEGAGAPNPAGTGHPNFLAAGNSNNPKEIFIEKVSIGRYGGVVFCVGSGGTKNYCGAILGNDGTKRWTLEGQNNALADGVIPEIQLGSPSSAATVDTPQIAVDMSGNSGTPAATGWKE